MSRPLMILWCGLETTQFCWRDTSIWAGNYTILLTGHFDSKDDAVSFLNSVNQSQYLAIPMVLQPGLWRPAHVLRELNYLDRVETFAFDVNNECFTEGFREAWIFRGGCFKEIFLSWDLRVEDSTWIRGIWLREIIYSLNLIGLFIFTVCTHFEIL